MNAGKAVYGILSANSGVTDIVGTNIFPEIAEQETAVPFIVYQLQSVDPDDTHDGPSKLDEVRFEFLCYADSYNAAADLGVAVRAALDRVSGTYNGVHVESIQFNDVDVNIEYDPRRYSQVLTFTFRIKRDDVTIALGTPVTGAVLGDLSDVDVTGVTNGQLIAYNSTSGNWEAANDAGGANELSDLSDANVSLPSDGEVLIYSGGEFVNDNISISNVTNLQSELDATPDSLDDLTDVKIIGTPSEGDALVYQSGFFSLGTAGASTLGDLTDVNTTGAGVGSLIQYNGASWDISAAELPSDAVYYHNRYASEAETLLDGATETVELYYTAQADGDGLHEDAQTDTAQSGYDIRRKLYYAEKAQADPNTSGDWTQFTAIADNTTFVNAKAALLAYLKERTGGTVPISLKMTWEEVAQAPAFTGLLNESYGSGAEAAYSTRRLNGNVTECMVIRRASDSTTTTIGFDSEGNIDEAAINTFCSGTTCTVSEWKDQSGNGNDATQSDSTKQPTIYTGGALVKENGKTALSMDYHFLMSSGINTNTFSIFATGRSSGDSYFMNKDGGNNQVRINRNNANYLSVYPSLQLSDAGTTYTQQLASYIGNASTLRFFQNSTAIGTGSSHTIDQDVIGGFTNQTQPTTMLYQELVVYSSDQYTAGNQSDIESNIGDYFTQNTPLLDTYSGAAAAYSLRLLDSTYSGSAIRVRRSNDNAEADIGFNVFGELDTVALAAHCGSNDGFVSKWYDQSGNTNTAAQTTTANMPKIYDGTTGVVTENGKAAVDNTNGGYFNLNSTITLTDFDIFSVVNTINSGQFYGYGTFIGNRATTNQMIWERVNNIALRSGGGDVQIAATSINGQKLVNPSRVSNVTGYFQNSTDIGTNNTATGNFTVANILDGYTSGGVQASGNFQEFIIYDSNQSANRTNIEDNINTFYSIY